jgi:hypothetical protein
LCKKRVRVRVRTRLDVATSNSFPYKQHPNSAGSSNSLAWFASDLIRSLNKCMGQAMELEAMARNRLIAASGPGKELGTSLLIYSLQNGEHKMSKA